MVPVLHSHSTEAKTNPADRNSYPKFFFVWNHIKNWISWVKKVACHRYKQQLNMLYVQFLAECTHLPTGPSSHPRRLFNTLAHLPHFQRLKRRSRRMCPSFWTYCWWTRSGKPINLIDKHPKYPKTKWLVSTIPQHLCTYSVFSQHISNPPLSFNAWYLLEAPLVANDCQSLVFPEFSVVITGGSHLWWSKLEISPARNAGIPGAKMW